LPACASRSCVMPPPPGMRSPIGGRSRRRSRSHTRDEHDGPGLSVRVKARRRRNPVERPR
jgi:hypothetical protein